MFGALARAEFCLGDLDRARENAKTAFAYALGPKKWHIMGNICETMAIIDVTDGKPELGLRHNKEAVRYFETIGDFDRAETSKRLLTDNNDIPWCKRFDK